MAPKASKTAAPATKRARETTATVTIAATAAKKSKVVSDPALTAVQEALQGSDLPDDCRAMLVALAPGSLSTLAADRQDLQALAVKMIGDAIYAHRKKLEQTVVDVESNLVEIESSRFARSGDVTKFESVLATREEEAAAKKEALSAASNAVLEARGVVEDALKCQEGGDAEFLEAAEQKKSIELGLCNDFLPLKQGVKPGSETVHLASLLSLVRSINVDESLATALPSSCTKQPSERGPFDRMAIEQVEVLMRQKIEEFAHLLASSEESIKERAAAVEAARSTYETMNENQQHTAAGFQAASSALRTATATLEAAKVAVTTFEPEYHRAVDAVAVNKTAFELFVSLNVASFEMLRDKAVPVQEQEETVVADVMVEFSADVCKVKVQPPVCIAEMRLAVGGQ